MLVRVNVWSMAEYIRGMSSASPVMRVQRIPYASLNFSNQPFDAVKEIKSSLFNLYFISIASSFSIGPSGNKLALVYFYTSLWGSHLSNDTGHVSTTTFKKFIFFLKSLCIVQDMGCTSFSSVKLCRNHQTFQFRVFACVLNNFYFFI